MDNIKTIALVAHDNCKKDLVEWVNWNWNLLLGHKLICTGTTGKLVEEALLRKIHKGHRLKHGIVKVKSGPFGGDQQLGAMIVDGKIDILIFFWDPMQLSCPRFSFQLSGFSVVMVAGAGTFLYSQP